MDRATYSLIENKNLMNRTNKIIKKKKKKYIKKKNKKNINPNKISNDEKGLESPKEKLANIKPKKSSIYEL